MGYTAERPRRPRENDKSFEELKAELSLLFDEMEDQQD